MKTGSGGAIGKEILNNLSGKKILNVGSGDGILSEYLRRKGYEVYDIDIGDFSQTGKQPILFDGKNIPYNGKEFDSVLCIYVLHHAEDFKILLKEMKRVSKNQIIILEDTLENFFDYFLGKIHLFIGYLRGWGKGGKFYGLKHWKKVFKNFELTLISNSKIKGSFFYPVPHTLFVLKKDRN